MPNPAPRATPSRLVHGDGPTHLEVDGRRFVVLGGELHNSSSSSAPAIGDALARVRDMNLNTVLAPVAWNQCEPREGVFDFSLVDELISTSRDRGLKLIPLWFGAWKNGRSTYVPRWVRADPTRFPRAEIGSRENRDCLSPFAFESAQAEARAFARLMAHIRDVDAEAGTVIMVQVDNEVGILGDSRDRSALAESHYRTAVPTDVIDALSSHGRIDVRAEWEARGRPSHGTWSSVLGDSVATDEAFMASAYARHLEHVAAAGKAEYPIPLFANAWLYTQLEVAEGNPAGGQAPGVYPSGGPLPHVGGIWTGLAPSIDLLAPDIYFGDFDQICRDYLAMSGGLLIPEMRRDIDGVADGFVALGEFSAIGVSPFGIDTLEGEEAEALLDAYESLGILLSLTDSSPSAGFKLNSLKTEHEMTLGSFIATARREPNRVDGDYEWGYGLIVQESPDTFLIAGRGALLAFRCADGPAELVKVEELTRVGAGVGVYRELSGDETESGTLVVLPSLERRPPSTSYHIPTIRRRSGVVRVTLAPAPAPASLA
jgi:hypothetical protein